MGLELQAFRFTARSKACRTAAAVLVLASQSWESVDSVDRRMEGSGIRVKVLLCRSQGRLHTLHAIINALIQSGRSSEGPLSLAD